MSHYVHGKSYGRNGILKTLALLKNCNTQHTFYICIVILSVIMQSSIILSVIMSNDVVLNGDCHNSESPQAESRYDERQYAEWRHAG